MEHYRHLLDGNVGFSLPFLMDPISTLYFKANPNWDAKEDIFHSNLMPSVRPCESLVCIRFFITLTNQSMLHNRSSSLKDLTGQSTQ